MKKYKKLRPIFSLIKEKNYLLLEGSYPSLSQGSQDTNRAIIWNVHCFDCLHCFLWALPPVYWAHTESFSWYLSPRTSTQSLSNWVARLISFKLSVFPRLRDPNFLFIMDKTLIKKTLQCRQWHLNQFALEATAPGAWQGAWRAGFCGSAVGPICQAGCPHQLQTRWLWGSFSPEVTCAVFIQYLCKDFSWQRADKEHCR